MVAVAAAAAAVVVVVVIVAVVPFFIFILHFTAFIQQKVFDSILVGEEDTPMHSCKRRYSILT